MALRPPIGVLVVAIGSLSFALIWALWLSVLWFNSDPLDHISTPWERVEAPIHIALLAITAASAIGLLLRNQPARIGLICAFATITAVLATSLFLQMTQLRALEPELSALFPPTWVVVARAATLPALATLVSAPILYGEASRRYFSERALA